MPERTFTTPPAKDEELAFTLEGVGYLTATPWSERFRVLPAIPGGLLDDLVSGSTVDADGNRVHTSESLLRFFEGTLYDEDIGRFALLVRDKDRAVDITQLGEIMEWVMEERVGRPTGGRPASRPGPPRGGPLSVAR